jgi:hypothetical protein
MRGVMCCIYSTFLPNSGDAIIQTALEGGGIAADKLRLVLQAFAPVPVPIHALFARPKLVFIKKKCGRSSII